MTLTLETPANAMASAMPAQEPLPSFAVQDIQADALQFIANLTRRGDVVQYRVKPWLVTFVNRPEHIKHVLQDHHRNYVKTGTPDFMMLKPMLGEGILTSDGDAWLKQRRLAQPAFIASASKASTNSLCARPRPCWPTGTCTGKTAQQSMWSPT